jgi:hypothetical protein
MSKIEKTVNKSTHKYTMVKLLKNKDSKNLESSPQRKIFSMAI